MIGIMVRSPKSKPNDKKKKALEEENYQSEEIDVEMEDAEAEKVVQTTNRCLWNKIVVEFNRLRKVEENRKIDILDEITGFNLYK